MSEQANKECAVVRDLIPLKLDNVCSAQSARLVDDHCARCPACAQFYQDMAAAAPAPLRQADALEAEDFRRALARLKRTAAFRTARTIALWVVWTALVLAAAKFGFTALCVTPSRVLPEDDCVYAVERSAQGFVNLTFKPKDESLACALSSFSSGDGIYYYQLKCALIPVSFGQSGAGAFMAGQYNWLTFGSDWFYSEGSIAPLRYSDWTRMPDGRVACAVVPGEPVAEIRLGTPEKYVTLYRAGDSVPLCAPENEARLRVDALEILPYDPDAAYWREGKGN